VPWPVAALLSVFGLGVILGLLLERVARVVVKAETTFQVAATVGLVVTIEALVTLWYGGSSLPFPAFLPTHAISIGGATVTISQLLTIGISVVVLGGLYVFLRTSRTGKLMRAVVDDPDLVRLAGSDPVAIRRWAWLIGANVATLTGVLVAPGAVLDPELLTLIVVAAFAAAAFGMFSSIPLSFLGGIVVGVAASIATKYTPGNEWLGGLPTALPFLILFVALVVMPRERLSGVEDQSRTNVSAAPQWRPPRIVALPMAIAFAALVAAVPSFAGNYLNTYSIGLALVILFLSLGLLVRVSRQVMLCQYAFAAVGAATLGHLLSYGIPWGVALLASGLVVVPVGLIVAIPAARLSGVFLGLATLGFALFLQEMFYSTPLMFGGFTGGLAIARPGGATDTEFYYMILVIALVATVAITALNRGRLGRLLTALGDAPAALETAGVSLNALRLVVLCICSFLAGISGALVGSVNLYATGTMFDTISSLTVFAVITFIVGATPWYAFSCAFAFAVLPIFLPGSSVVYLQALFGVAAVGHAYLQGLGKQPASATPMPIQRIVDRLAGKPGGAEPASPSSSRPGALSGESVGVSVGWESRVRGVGEGEF
jgi:branched-subunit amino acid ABC-type transport system permease component